jgi:hypothetical protein
LSLFNKEFFVQLLYMQRLSSPNPYIVADHKCSQLRTVNQDHLERMPFREFLGGSGERGKEVTSLGVSSSLLEFIELWETLQQAHINVFSQDFSAPISNPEMCAPSNLQQLGLGQICLGPMNPVVQYWLTPAWKHLHHLTLRKPKLLSKGLNNVCYSVLASILRQTQ